ncbi:hypothetical protein MLD38_018930 [Melastoma candidum]|uniref:Uncharacterized protein n=1 Tax=Melastoma candidum TaxID=119954 RepID=A0ACB9QVA5_9MYRT|nr:hypothetical protein MLD38_018930 [Melastoma candidum]
MVKVMLDSLTISHHMSIVALVGVFWTYSLQSSLDQKTVVLIDVGVLMSSGFLSLQLTEKMTSFGLLLHHLIDVSFSAIGLYMLASVYETLTISISSDSTWGVAMGLLIVHLFLHDYSQSTVRAPVTCRNPTLTSRISLNASIVASRLPSWCGVFAVMWFSFLVFMFAPPVTFCIKKYSSRLYMLNSNY